MKQNEKLLLGLLVLEFLLSCAWGLPQVVNAEIPQQVAEKARNATVRIEVRIDRRGTDDSTKIGSGFFIEPDKIVTNIHVVAGATSISVDGKDGTESFTYSIEGSIGSIPTYDVVILQVSGERRGKPLSLGKGKKGDLIFASGYPADKYKVTKGTIHSIQSDGQLRLTAKRFSKQRKFCTFPG